MSNAQTQAVRKGSSAAVAVVWTFAANQAENLLAIANTMLLARLLSPADFGIVAIATAVVALGEVFIAFGFDWAVLRIQNPTRAHYDTAWTLRALGGLLIFLIVCGAAWPASAILKQPQTPPLIVAIAATGFLVSLQNIGIVDFRRHMRMDLEFRLRLAAKVAGVSAGILTALVWRSYWALVVGLLASRLTHTLLSYLMHGFRPRFDLSRRGELLSFSIWMLIGKLAEVFRNRFSDMWLGRNLGASSAGYYILASELSALASGQISAPVQRVMFTRYAEQANSREMLKDAYFKVSGVVWIVAFPAAVGIGVCAEQIVMVLLGSQWSTSATILQILAAAGLLAVMSSSTYTIYMASGRPRLAANLSVLGAVMFIILTLALGSLLGLLGVALAQVLSWAVTFLTNLYILRSIVGVSIRLVLARAWRIAFASAGMAVIVLLISTLLARYQFPDLVELIVLGTVGVVCYFSLLLLLWIVSGKQAGPESDILEIAARHPLGRKLAATLGVR